ncbi:hypothetical protein C4J97_3512 [Pseudomonas orientalis]|nr:hypothetical protein C4J97_3512 [Pseudomonas orientalis]
MQRTAALTAGDNGSNADISSAREPKFFLAQVRFASKNRELNTLRFGIGQKPLETWNLDAKRFHGLGRSTHSHSERPAKLSELTVEQDCGHGLIIDGKCRHLLFSR